MLTVADDDVFDDVDRAAGVDADAAGGDLAVLGGGVLGEFEDVAVFGRMALLRHAGGHGELDVALEVAVIAVDGDEELGLDELIIIFSSSCEPWPETWIRPLVPSSVDDVGVAALEVIDDAVDGFLVAGDDARAHQDGVAGVDLGELVVVDGGPGERGHGLALGAGDHEEQLVGGEVA